MSKKRQLKCFASALPCVDLPQCLMPTRIMEFCNVLGILFSVIFFLPAFLTVLRSSGISDVFFTEKSGSLLRVF